MWQQENLCYRRMGPFLLVYKLQERQHCSVLHPECYCEYHEPFAEKEIPEYAKHNYKADYAKDQPLVHWWCVYSSYKLHFMPQKSTILLGSHLMPLSVMLISIVLRGWLVPLIFSISKALFLMPFFFGV